MRRTYIPQLVRITIRHREYLQRHQARINQFLDAAGQSDLQACVDCATTLLSKLESLAPGSTLPEEP